ncbi:MAG: sigma-54-dependent Fis family transcriptional regulator [Deltaproteobacteria bacterium]|nr:sigma-54-dependent Fis family transcriptional regulator [Deltaproteobacteria bacterium]
MTCSTKNPYVAYPKDRQKTFGLWERFNVTEPSKSVSSDPYERLIHADWSRCKKLGVDPTMRQGVLVAADEFADILKNRSLLIEKAKPALTRVHDLLVDVPGILIFTDEQGTILQISGDSDVQDAAAESSRIVEGSRWLESLAGTNGIGTAIARKGPVHVYSTEHFCEGWHRWTCAASPIMDPFGESVMGVIDFTTIDRDYRDDALALTYSIATSITTELRLQFELERMQLIHNFSMHRSRYPADAVVVVDRMNRVVRSSAAVAEGQTLPPVLPEQGRGATREVREIRSAGTNDPIGQLVILGERRRVRAGARPDAGGHELTAFGDFVTGHPGVKTLLGQIGRVIPSNLSVLLIGETGTGKELIASHIHETSPRRAGPFVAVNCGAISRELFESRFFGYERGAFTGADPRGRQGLFEAANGGTLFLDEVGEMPLDIQTGLLRVLETGRFRRVGSLTEVSTDCRIIAATNRSLLEESKQGGVRSDLYYRLSVASFVIPPLRERPADIPVLVDHLSRRIARSHGVSVKRFTPDAVSALASWTWPGNVRELRNVLETAMVCADDPIGVRDLPAAVREKPPRDPVPAVDRAAAVAGRVVTRPTVPAFDSTERGFGMKGHVRTLVVSALEELRNVSHVAKALGISRSRLYRLFKSLNIDYGQYVRCVRPQTRKVSPRRSPPRAG